jgi:hypothetical protein
MNFKPRTEQELVDMRLWKKGIYDFEIVDAFETASKTKGNPMIELKVRITGTDGAARIITDYLLEQRGEKLRHAAQACGLIDKYESGSISNTDFQHKRGKLKLGVEKDRSHTYPDKNVVLDYVVSPGAPGSGSGGAIGYAAFTQ